MILGAKNYCLKEDMFLGEHAEHGINPDTSYMWENFLMVESTL